MADQFDHNQAVIDLMDIYQDEEGASFDSKSLLKYIYYNGYQFVPR